MQCHVCERENPDDSRFCNGCGTSLEFFCSTCGSELAGPEEECRPCDSQGDLSAEPELSGKRPRYENGASSTDVPGDSDFVGRSEELKELRLALDESISGRGSIVMLVGDPGIGKTRTALELTTYAESHGVRVLWGRCYESDGAPPYWPWVQVIRSSLRDKDVDDMRSEMGQGAADIATIVPEISDLLPDLTHAGSIEDPEQARFRLFNSVSAYLSAASRSQPLLLVLDNLHGADKASLLLLEFLAQELRESRLLVLGTYRDIEVSRRHPLMETLAELSRAPRFRRLQLVGLGVGEVGSFVKSQGEGTEF